MKIAVVARVRRAEPLVNARVDALDDRVLRVERGREFRERVGRHDHDGGADRKGDDQREIRAPRLETPEGRAEPGVGAQPPGDASDTGSDAPNERRKEREGRTPEGEKEDAEGQQRDHGTPPRSAW